MPSDDQIIESTATDYVRFPLWVLEDIDLSTLTWSVSFNPTDIATEAPVPATIVTSSQSTTRTGPRSDITLQVLVGSGSGGTPLAPGRWHCFAHTVSGDRIIEVYLGVLTVSGPAGGTPAVSHATFRVLRGPAPADLDLPPGVIYFYINDDGSVSIAAGEYA